MDEWLSVGPRKAGFEFGERPFVSVDCISQLSVGYRSISVEYGLRHPMTFVRTSVSAPSSIVCVVQADSMQTDRL